MKPLLFISAAALVLVTAAACTPGGPPKVRAALDCPTSQGELDRTSVAPDGKSCLYASRDGDEVSLRLIPVSASYEATLQPVEQELQGEVQTEPQQAEAKAKDAEASAKVATAEATAAVSAAAKAAKEASDDAASAAKAAGDWDDGKDKGGRSDHARVDLPGIHIEADDDGKANVNVGMIHVNAGEDGAVVRMARDVRLRGEAFSREKRGFRASYIVAKDNLKDGWKAVGYEAAGPKAGPITVAVVKSKSGEHHDVFADVKRLVRRNGGV